MKKFLIAAFAALAMLFTPVAASALSFSDVQAAHTKLKAQYPDAHFIVFDQPMASKVVNAITDAVNGPRIDIDYDRVVMIESATADAVTIILFDGDTAVRMGTLPLSVIGVVIQEALNGS